MRGPLVCSFLWELVIGLGLPSSVNAGTNQKSISSRLRLGAEITSAGCRMRRRRHEPA